MSASGIMVSPPAIAMSMSFISACGGVVSANAATSGAACKMVIRFIGYLVLFCLFY